MKPLTFIVSYATIYLSTCQGYPSQDIKKDDQYPDWNDYRSHPFEYYRPDNYHSNHHWRDYHPPDDYRSNYGGPDYYRPDNYRPGYGRLDYDRPDHYRPDYYRPYYDRPDYYRPNRDWPPIIIIINNRDNKPYLEKNNDENDQIHKHKADPNSKVNKEYGNGRAKDVPNDNGLDGGNRNGNNLNCGRENCVSVSTTNRPPESSIMPSISSKTETNFSTWPDFTITNQSEELESCLLSCQLTLDYSPVCGSNFMRLVTFYNPSLFICAQQCGIELQQRNEGPCSANDTQSTHTSTISNLTLTTFCLFACRAESIYNPPCEVDGSIFQTGVPKCNPFCEYYVKQKITSNCSIVKSSPPPVTVTSTFTSSSSTLPTNSVDLPMLVVTKPVYEPSTSISPTSERASTATSQVNTTPDVKRCLLSCTGLAEYDPVCGTDFVTYNNVGLLECAKDCGVVVEVLESSTTCEDLLHGNGSRPVTPSPDCMGTCPISSHTSPVCGTDNITYKNSKHLACAQMCGSDVKQKTTSNCSVVENTPPTVIESSVTSTFTPSISTVPINPVDLPALAATTPEYEPITSMSPSTELASTAISPVVTTPDVKRCLLSCTGLAEYDPVCGTNFVTYNHVGLLVCAKDCGVVVEVLRNSTTCEKLLNQGGSRPVTPSPDCMGTCPIPSHNSPVCGTDFITYKNLEHLKCAQMCGSDVEVDALSECRPASPAYLSPSKPNDNVPEMKVPEVTVSPLLRICLLTCPVTAEYNPVCGSNGVTYNSSRHLECATICGLNIKQKSQGRCPEDDLTTTIAPNIITVPSVTRLVTCLKDCSVPFVYTPPCEVDVSKYGDLGYLKCAIHCGIDIKLKMNSTCPKVKVTPSFVVLDYIPPTTAPSSK